MGLKFAVIFPTFLIFPYFKTEDKPGNIMLALFFVVTGLLLTS